MQIMRSAQVLDKLQFGAIALITIAQVSIAWMFIAPMVIAPIVFTRCWAELGTPVTQLYSYSAQQGVNY